MKFTVKHRLGFAESGTKFYQVSSVVIGDIGFYWGAFGSRVVLKADAASGSLAQKLEQQSRTFFPSKLPETLRPEPGLAELRLDEHAETLMEKKRKSKSKYSWDCADAEEVKEEVTLKQLMDFLNAGALNQLSPDTAQAVRDKIAQVASEPELVPAAPTPAAARQDTAHLYEPDRWGAW